MRGKRTEVVSGEAQPQDRDSLSLEGIRAEISSLLRSENVSFLLGAGCSVPVGGMVFAKVYKDYWQDVIDSYKNETDKIPAELLLNGLLDKYRQLLGLNTHPVSILKDDAVDFTFTSTSTSTDEIEQDSTSIIRRNGNFEEFLTKLYNLQSGAHGLDILEIPSGNQPNTNVKPSNVDNWRNSLTDRSLLLLTDAMRSTLVKKLDLIQNIQEDAAGAAAYLQFVRKLASRPHTLTRPKIFTLNYDLMVEWASDKEGAVLIDGFRGSRQRIFRPEVYDQDFYYPAGHDYSEPRRLEQVLHLYKLHGSLNWRVGARSLENPFGVSADFGDLADTDPAEAVVIYPMPTKYAVSHSLPFAEMFRRFADSTIRPQSVLFVIGYSFGDEHVNAIIDQALAYPSFTMVIVSPRAHESKYIRNISGEYDPGIWCFSGSDYGTFEGFVRLLPDLLDEERTREVMKRRAELARNKKAVREGDKVSSNGENDPSLIEGSS